ncbi:MAG: DUF427 domain-containing protein [Actinomycetota bacterium]
MTTKARGRVRVENTQKRVRAQVGGVMIADSTSVKMVWEIPYFPTYYFPADDVRLDLLNDSGETKRSPSRGTADLFDVSVGDRTIRAAARVWNDSKLEEISGYISFSWDAMDRWFEEDEEVHYHARDPYTRIEILPSSRTVRVEVDGVVVAESDKTRFLFESNLPVRYYFPKPDVRFEYLEATSTASHCPYKGTARYWSINTVGETHHDVAWGYDSTFPESQLVAGFVAFYNEKLDIYVDGVLEEKPKTKFA